MDQTPDVADTDGGDSTNTEPRSGETVLVRVEGKDGPGITAGLLHVLGDAGAEVLDMEQVVIRDRLSLGILISMHPSRSPLRDLLYFGWERGVNVDFEAVGEADDTPLSSRFAVTVLGEELSPAALGVVTDAIADAGGNIERIARLSKYPVMSYELLVTGGDYDQLKTDLITASADAAVDIAVQRQGLTRRAKRLVVIDMDSTLVRDEAIDLLATAAGVGDDVASITTEAMEGSLDFEQALRDRVTLLAGLGADVLATIADSLRLTPGARTFVRTLHRLGFTVAIVSGGFMTLTEPLQRRLDIEYAFANQLEIIDGKLTGRLLGRIVDGETKADILREIAEKEAIPIDQTVAVGDGANDLEMLSAAGLGIAFNAKPIVGEFADASVTVPYLDAILFVLGIRREEVEHADLIDPP